MGEGEGRVIWWPKQIKKVTKEKSHFACSISLIVLYNKVNHTLCNALRNKLFTFCVNMYIAKGYYEETRKVELILVKTPLFSILWKSLILNNCLQLYCKRDSSAGVFLWILRNLKQHFFYRTLPVCYKIENFTDFYYTIFVYLNIRLIIRWIFSDCHLCFLY